ncbi:hypothetical protein GGS20DRAFT_558150 [Poronia punctata]|nr:hypothetical protein GGS20DRAFT_558150 [Poronia punctata]
MRNNIFFVHLSESNPQVVNSISSTYFFRRSFPTRFLSPVQPTRPRIPPLVSLPTQFQIRDDTDTSVTCNNRKKESYRPYQTDIMAIGQNAAIALAVIVVFLFLGIVAWQGGRLVRSFAHLMFTSRQAQKEAEQQRQQERDLEAGEEQQPRRCHRSRRASATA